MRAYCTYFDQGYLAQGVALWESLARHDPAAHLMVLALDDTVAAVAATLAPGRVRVVRLDELLAGDAGLAAVQATRPRREFIFALTPCLVRHVFSTQSGLDHVAYVDADLYFFADPAAAWAELGGGSVLIVPHRYPPWHDDSARYGRFNVGLLIFRNVPAAQACIGEWREQCLGSTALAADGTHFGDQKYLDAWPGRFAGVVESRHPGVNVAPWNWARHRFDWAGGGVRVDGAPLVVFHFAQFRRVSGRWFDSGQLEYGIMPSALRSRIYGTYVAALQAAEARIARERPGFALPAPGWRAALGAWHLAFLRLGWGQFWFWSGTNLIAARCGLGRFSGRVMAVYRRGRRRAG